MSENDFKEQMKLFRNTVLLENDGHLLISAIFQQTCFSPIDCSTAILVFCL